MSECPSCDIFRCLKEKLGDDKFLDEILVKLEKKEITADQAADEIIKRYGREKVFEALKECASRVNRK